MDLNTCWETTNAYHTIAYYSHIVPILIAVFLGLFAYIKSKGSSISLAFASFTFSFSLWLAGDLVDWVSSDYTWVYFTWSWLDLVNVVFFIFGSYFFTLLARDRVSQIEKGLLVLLALPAFVITASGYSVTEFTQSVCEAVNNSLLTQYKLVVEGLLVLWMLTSLVRVWKSSTIAKRVQLGVILLAILLFFTTFASTEYFSSITGIYEINLYSLFVLPVFLIVMVFAVTNLGLFNFRFLGTQILSYVLILMTGSQLLFVQDTTHTTLAVITLAISMIFGILLLQNSQKEEQARVRIEHLAGELERLNDQQVVLIHFITHQIKGFIAKSRNIFSMALEGDFGSINDDLKPILQAGFESDTKGAMVIAEILNAANIKSGKVTFTLVPFDLRLLVEEVAKDFKATAENKGLKFTIDVGATPAMIKGDRAQLVNVFRNLIDNSIKYTLQGEINLRVRISEKTGGVIFETQDTGVGITPEDMKNLFTEGGHGKESTRVNVESTGFGLFIVKSILEAHNATIKAESEGAGKGSHFTVEFPSVEN
jgi:signal transduction histidine kinase